MQGHELRKAFLEYFKRQGHTTVPSSSLVPASDPTLLFSNAGMNQFKDCFLGADVRPYVRAATCQKCLRISGKHNDLENVGITARHHTFFEMLGNFSFGDYFKADAIKFAFEFVTETLGIPLNRLWVTIYEKDDEAAKLWRELTKIPSERILRMGEKDNFWAMGETGPCGPCSELHYFLGADEKKQSEAAFRKDDGTYLEIWNLVFMQYNRDASGKLTPLPKPSVDTGMGLERTAAVLQNVAANYDTDLLRPIISKCEELSGFTYNGKSYQERDIRSDKAYAQDVAMRVIADHSRAISFLIADGVTPSNEGRGYVLRRLIRRAVRHGRVLMFKEPFLAHTTERVISMFSQHYPELSEHRELIRKLSQTEETKFHETLDAGLQILTREAEKLKSGAPFPGETAFLLHDTYGFPLDLTEDALKGFGTKVDVSAFEKAMDKQKARSREDRKSQAISYSSVKVDGPKTKFVGYSEKQAQGKLLHIIYSDGQKSVKAGGEALLIFDTTPFYAESGGQVGDTGTITIKDTTLKVLDTQKIQDGYFAHMVEVLSGEITSKLVGEKASLSIDEHRRSNIRANHSATHLLHAALRKVLGTHVKQAGSRVDDVTLRFDYSHFEPVSDTQLADIQSFINSEIRQNYEVSTQILPVDEAKRRGAMALFGEKYGDQVRVVEIGPNSLELCGGTHVSRSGDIGFLIVGSETGISAGVRRIECWAGINADRELSREREERLQISTLLRSDAQNLPDKVERLIKNNKAYEREIETLRARLASSGSDRLVESARVTTKGVRVIVEQVDGADSDTLRSMVDTLRVKLGSGVVALGSPEKNNTSSALIVAGATSDLLPNVHVGNLLKEVVKISGGRGGGRADFAQAGGVDPTRLNLALEKFFELLQ